MKVPFPWQETQWQRLQQADAGGRLPHALLLSAPAGTGLHEFAEQWIRARLCHAEKGPCGRCPACEQLRAGTHPDLVRIEPEEAGKAIGIDVVRAMNERIGLTAGSRGKIALIDPADALTLQAANSLLKTLEEPPAGSMIMLLSTRPSRLPATVRSRCQKIAFGLPERNSALAWLREQGLEDPAPRLARAGGAPLIALDPEQAAEEKQSLVEGLLDTLERGAVPPELPAQVSGLPLQTSLPVLSTVVSDLIRLRTADATTERLHHPDHRQRMQDVAARLDVRAMFHYLDELNRAIPGPSSALRPDMQMQGLLADATVLRRAAGSKGGGR